MIALLLAFAVSGAASLVIAEPCASLESASSSSPDDVCPPSCVTCGCCHQAADVALVMPALAPLEQPRELPEPRPPQSHREPRGILHVPRRA